MLGTVSPRVTPINSRDIDTGGGGDLSRATTAVVTHSQSQTDLDRRLDPEEGGRPEGDNDSDASSDDDDDDNDNAPEMKQLLLARKIKQMEQSLWHQLVTTCSYHNLKATMKWILDEATLRLALNVWLQAATAMSVYLSICSTVHLITERPPLCYAMLQFEDVTMLMTVYILFADDIKLLTLPRQVPTDLT